MRCFCIQVFVFGVPSTYVCCGLLNSLVMKIMCCTPFAYSRLPKTTFGFQITSRMFLRCRKSSRRSSRSGTTTSLDLSANESAGRGNTPRGTVSVGSHGCYFHSSCCVLYCKARFRKKGAVNSPPPLPPPEPLLPPCMKFLLGRGKAVYSPPRARGPY